MNNEKNDKKHIQMKNRGVMLDLNVAHQKEERERKKQEKVNNEKNYKKHIQMKNRGCYAVCECCSPRRRKQKRKGEK